MARGLGKLGPENLPDRTKGGDKATGKPFPVGGAQGEERTTITHHADGTHTSEHADGTKEEHPDHLHLVASLGHKLSGGDKHDVVEDTGGGFRQHGGDEAGEHYGTHDHDTVDALKDSMGKYLGGEEDGTAEAQPEERDQAYGGMRG